MRPEPGAASEYLSGGTRSQDRSRPIAKTRVCLNATTTMLNDIFSSFGKPRRNVTLSLRARSTSSPRIYYMSQNLVSQYLEGVSLSESRGQFPSILMNKALLHPFYPMMSTSPRGGGG